MSTPGIAGVPAGIGIGSKAHEDVGAPTLP